MQAAFVSAHGGLEALTVGDLPSPEIQEDEVLLKVAACGMNHLDCWVRKGVPGHKFPLPLILGSDGAGVVKRVGARVTHVAVGDRVAVSPGYAPDWAEESLDGRHNESHLYGVIGEHRNGLGCEFAAIPARNLLPMPESMSFEDAAAFPLAALTAHHMIARRAQVKPGMDVLVHAAGSGVSIMAIQFAKVYGARVIVTSTSDAKLERAKELGADLVINSTKEDFVRRVKEITLRRGVDVVVDHVGEKTFGGSLQALARGGAVVTCGATSGPKLEADLRLIFFKSLSILGSTMGGLGEMQQVWRMACRGQVKPVIDRVLPLSRVAEGHTALEQRQVFGKVILLPGQ